RVTRTNSATGALWRGGREVTPGDLQQLEVWDEHGSPVALGDTPMLLAIERGVTTRRKLLHYRTPDGELLSVRVNVVPLGDDDAPAGAAILIADVTTAERIQARLAAAIAVAREAIMVISRDGSIRYVNRTARSMLGGEGLPDHVSIDVFFERDSREELR